MPKIAVVNVALPCLQWPERKAQQDPYRLDTLCRELLNVTAPQVGEEVSRGVRDSEEITHSRKGESGF